MKKFLYPCPRCNREAVTIEGMECFECWTRTEFVEAQHSASVVAWVVSACGLLSIIGMVVFFYRPPWFK